jgi:competence protein ComEC
MRLPKNFNNPGSFNYQRYLAFQDIFVTASLDAKHAMVKVGEHPCNPVIYRTERIRQRINDLFAARLATPAAEIATALITGEQSGIPQEMRDQFSVAGVSHVLAISGLNIGIIALIALSIAHALCRCSIRVMLMTDSAKLAAVLTLIPVTFYCLIAGAGIAVLRATVMVIVYLFSIIIDRQDDLWNTLALAALLILVVSPSSLFDCSFQLSFISVAAILYLNPRLSLLFARKPDAFPGMSKRWYHSLRAHITTVLTVTLAATIGTAPLVAFYFNRCSPWGIPANLILVPLTGFLVVPLGLLASILLFVAKPLAVITAEIMEALLNLSNAAVGFFSALPYADYRITTPTLPEMIIYYAGVVLTVNCRRSIGARYGMAVVLIAFMSDAGYWYYQNNLNPRLRITAIDVGQGESSLLQLPGGTTMLIDGGGSYDSGFDTGGMVVSPLLWRNKLRRIDILVLSHPHPDHLNGLVSVIKNFDIGEVWSTGEGIDTEAYRAFESLIAERTIRRRAVANGDPPYQVNGVMVEFLHPAGIDRNQPNPVSLPRLNNNSLVMRVRLREVSVLFTGDIYAADEGALLSRYPGLTSTIIKIPHHGSATSSSKEFIAKLGPRIALLSVGRDNSFNLPHPDVVARYEAAGCRIFRTDRDGAVNLETDGRSVHVRSFFEERQPIAAAQQLAMIELYKN